MKIGDKVKVNVEEPEYMPYHGQTGTVVNIIPADVAVKFKDGQICYFELSELEVPSCEH